MKRERLEDLGVIWEKLRQVLELPIFEHCDSKHGFESWVKSMTDEQFPDETLYEIHAKIRVLKDQLVDCILIARGEDE